MLYAALAQCACERPAAPPQPDTAAQIVDSILPIAEEMRRFRAEHGVTEPVPLRGGSPTRDALVRAFVMAIEQSDTVALRALVMDAAEFITLYYPTSLYAREPYRQSPRFVWFQYQQHSHQGLSRILQRFGGASTGFAGYDCAGPPRQQGKNRLWENCLVRWQLHEMPVRLFGSIIERDGHFKFVSYTNDF